MLLTTVPLPADWSALPVTAGDLRVATALLVPHDGLPVADVQGLPERWALLQLVTQALRRDVPMLAWGSGAALVGRALGARVQAGEVEWAELPRGAVAVVWQGDRPLHWTYGSAGRVIAYAGRDLPDELRRMFLAALPGWSSRRAAAPLEVVGGEDALQALLAEFYERARQDDLIGPTFQAHVQDWDAHLERVTAFWVTLLGGGLSGQPPRWHGNLNAAHAGLGIRPLHLERWLHLWTQTALESWPPEAAQVVISRAQQMAGRIQSIHAENRKAAEPESS